MIGRRRSRDGQLLSGKSDDALGRFRDRRGTVKTSRWFLTLTRSPDDSAGRWCVSAGRWRRRVVPAGL